MHDSDGMSAAVVSLPAPLALHSCPMARSPDNLSPRIVNRRATFEYHISEKLEVGISLLGSEVKSIRAGQVSLGEGFARVEPGDHQLYLHNIDIALYPQAGERNHEPKRTRKLLAHRRQIDKLETLTSSKGVTLVPLAMYFVRGMVKLEIGVGEGKKSADKRQDIRKRETQREVRRAMTRKTL